MSAIEQLLSAESLTAVRLPIHEIKSATLLGYELLIRDTSGLFDSPDQLFAAARESNQVMELDLKCLSACLSAIPAVPEGMRVHVNILPDTLERLDVQVYFENMLAKSAGRQLCIELVEQPNMVVSDQLINRVERLRAANIRVAIDDVGFGLTSLEAVAKLPVDVLKIDRCVVTNAVLDERKREVLSRIVKIAKSLGTACVAEGVDFPHDRDFMSSLQVEMGQGLLYGPLP